MNAQYINRYEEDSGRSNRFFVTWQASENAFLHTHGKVVRWENFFSQLV